MLMTDGKVIDNDGEWVVNNCRMAMFDGKRQIRFEPFMPVKVKVEGWVAVQLEAKVLRKIEAAPKSEPVVKAPTPEAKETVEEQVLNTEPKTGNQSAPKRRSRRSS